MQHLEANKLLQLTQEGGFYNKSIQENDQVVNYSPQFE